MDILSFLTSISKLAVGTFIITVLIIGYEIYHAVHKHGKNKKVEITEFDTGKKRTPQSISVVRKVQSQPLMKETEKRKKYILIGIVALCLLVFSGIVFFARRVSEEKFEREIVAVEPTSAAQDIGDTDFGLGGTGLPATPTSIPSVTVISTMAPIILTPTLFTTLTPTTVVASTSQVTSTPTVTITPTMSILTEAPNPTNAVESLPISGNITTSIAIAVISSLLIIMALAF